MSIFNKQSSEIDPDEIFGDALNMPGFREEQFEGRIEKPIPKSVPLILGFFFLFIGIIYAGRVGFLQVARGDYYSSVSERNSLKHIPLFSERGVIYDRNKKELAWNSENKERGFSERRYIKESGFGHILGYVSEPKLDQSGRFWQTESFGMDGAEKEYDSLLRGNNGVKIVETDVSGSVISESLIDQPKPGENISLTIDSRLQGKLHELISSVIDRIGFTGGAGLMMEVTSGEILALVSSPEYDPNTLVSGDDQGAIKRYLNDKKKPFLNRAVSGLYTPGSTVKPFIAMGALNEGVITPEKQIYSAGFISIPNPYDVTKPTIFKDWKAHGYVNMWQAIAVSSDVYFYEVGGGFEGQKGLGIENIEKYVRMFGLGEETGIDIGPEARGIIPNPKWKEKNFSGEKWLIGNTYHTAIGQFGFQITPIQLLRAVSAIANGGYLVTPHIKKPEGVDDYMTKRTKINLSEENFQIVRDGMRQSVEYGTASGLATAGLKIAGKTGTAELGLAKDFVNSWVMGFFPYDKPKYAFVVVMERGPRGNTTGGVYIMRQMIDWMLWATPEYFK